MTALRLRLSDKAPGQDRLDGGWWPHGRSLATEFAQLVDDFPDGRGRIIRAVYSPPDWDDAPRRVEVARGFVKVGKFPSDDTHVIYVTTSDRVELCLLVVPPAFSAGQGEEALLAATSGGSRRSARTLLDTVLDEPAADPADLWTADAGR